MVMRIPVPVLSLPLPAPRPAPVQFPRQIRFPFPRPITVPSEVLLSQTLRTYDTTPALTPTLTEVGGLAVGVGELLCQLSALSAFSSVSFQLMPVPVSVFVVVSLLVASTSVCFSTNVQGMSRLNWDGVAGSCVVG